MADTSPRRRFNAAFARWSRRVRRRLALELILTGAAAGMVLGAAGAAAAWQKRHGALRPWMAAGGLLGAAAGAAAARRRRWSDPNVALFLDGKLGSSESISTAVELTAAERTEVDAPRGSASAAHEVVLAHAAAALEGATAQQVRAPMWRSWHAGAPLAAAVIGYLTWLPLPPAPAAAAPPPGAEQVRLAEIAGLERVIQLAEIDARDAEQRERLKKLAEDAKALRQKLRSGVERREAQADIGRLRDAITAERLSLGEGEQRQGMESALGKLGEDPEMRRAAKALGDRDLVAFDEEMERLANRLEEDDRARARKTLEEAAEAAKRAGAPGVAKALEEQRKLLDQRGEQADKLRELAEALGESLGDEGREALGDLGRTGSDRDARRLADSLEEALEKLSPEERKQLADRLKQQIARSPGGAPGEPTSEEQMRQLARQLETPEGQRLLEEHLRRMAQEGGPSSEESGRQRALDDAQRGADEAEGQLGGTPLPTPVAGGSGPSGPSGGPGQGGQQGSPAGGSGNQGPAQPGHSEGGGPGSHDGQTGAIAGGELRSRASARLNPGRPMPGIVMGRTAGRAGDTANVQGEGALGVVGPQEIGGVERSDVPEEYREQVGRYFQPR
ncbi:hypothetical protein [Sorangium cellulosum]|uniref:Uncharacterized protein n=1 Tax=Sorangium cellulosum TaxID=56 RepID=A0A150QED0_SORCE|nr:hypothetical protein [Sorangium cellulosum]KYF66329.1 hypothetical protein BE15_01670 [Sorangium cellulosum]